jgi:hypothetical protein
VFEVLTTTTAKVREIEVLSQKNRAEGEAPGVKIDLEFAASNYLLTGLDGYVRGALFAKEGKKQQDGQGSIDGVEQVSDMPILTNFGKRCGWISWEQDLTGYHLLLAIGIATDASNLDLTDCQITGLRFKPQEGGSCLFRCSVEAPNASTRDWQILPGLKSRDVEVTHLKAPEPAAQADVEDISKARKRSKGEAAAAGA